MAENNEQPQAADANAQPKVVSRLLAQFIRDMSFENVLAQKGAQGEVQPEMQVKVTLDARKRPIDNQYEVLTKLIVTNTNKVTKTPIFLLEIEYAGVFHIEGLPEEQMHPYLMIECPRQTFPYLRRIVSDVTQDGGFPAVNLDTIDFMALYRQEIARRVEAQKTDAKPN